MKKLMTVLIFLILQNANSATYSRFGNVKKHLRKNQIFKCADACKETDTKEEDEEEAIEEERSTMSPAELEAKAELFCSPFYQETVHIPDANSTYVSYEMCIRQFMDIHYQLVGNDSTNLTPSESRYISSEIQERFKKLYPHIFRFQFCGILSVQYLPNENGRYEYLLVLTNLSGQRIVLTPPYQSDIVFNEEIPQNTIVCVYSNLPLQRSNTHYFIPNFPVQAYSTH